MPHSIGRVTPQQAPQLGSTTAERRANVEVRTNGLGKAQSFFGRLGAGIQRAFRSFGNAVTNLRNHGAGQTPIPLDAGVRVANEQEHERDFGVLFAMTHQSVAIPEPPLEDPKLKARERELTSGVPKDLNGILLQHEASGLIGSEMYKESPDKERLLATAKAIINGEIPEFANPPDGQAKRPALHLSEMVAFKEYAGAQEISHDFNEKYKSACDKLGVKPTLREPWATRERDAEVKQSRAGISYELMPSKGEFLEKEGKAAGMPAHRAEQKSRVAAPANEPAGDSIEALVKELRTASSRDRALDSYVSDLLGSDMYEKAPDKADFLKDAKEVVQSFRPGDIYNPSKPTLAQAVALRQYPKAVEAGVPKKQLADMKKLYDEGLKKA